MGTQPKSEAYRHRDRERGNTKCSCIACIAITGATEVHRALCAPQQQRIGSYEIACRVLPARNVGGDFICSFRHPDRTFALLGDLMGKGLSAAMWITHMVDLIHRAAEGVHDAGGLLGQLNLEVLNSRVRAPLTSAIGIVIDNTTGHITCSSAGHPPAVILRRDSQAELTASGGHLLGASANARYTAQDLTLATGDSLVAFSDGLIEATNVHGRQFTLERAVAALADRPALAPADKISHLLNASLSFAGDHPVDDISVMVVQRP